MKTRATSFVLGLCGLVVMAATAHPALAGPDASAPAWKIAGQLEEACTCDSACPCWFGNKPTRMSCGGGEFLFIEKGNYGNVNLDGLAVGGMVESADGKSMMESFGSWKFNNVYIDEKATPEQRSALDTLAKVMLEGDASPHREVRYVPLKRTIDGDLHKISLGQYGSFSGHLVDGIMGGHPKIVNPPMADPLHKEYDQGTATSLKYTDAGNDWNYAGTNYMYGTFEVDNVEFEKFAAAMSKMMQAGDKPVAP